MNKIFLVAVLSAVLILFGCSQEQNVISDQPVLGEEIEENVAGTVEGNSEETINEVTLFDVHGSNNYRFNPAEIRVKKGDKVRITFSSEEGFHDLVLDEFNVATKRFRSDEGEETVEFVADQIGEFEYYCSVGDHRARGQVGKLVVEE